MTEYSEFFDFVEASETIAIFMHINPDGDCVSSSLALYNYLLKLNKRVFCIAPDLNIEVLPKKMSYLPHFEDISLVSPLPKYDMSIGVDVGDDGRLGDTCYRIFIKSDKNFVIDHHKIHKDFAQKTIREADAASTTQILYKMLVSYNPGLIDIDIATCLYTGLVTDSGGFTFSCTTPETHRIAAELLDYGIDGAEICRRALKDVDRQVFKLRSKVLSRTEFIEGGRIAYLYIGLDDFAETETNERDTDGMVNTILDIVGVELAISITAIKDKAYKVSFRSKGNVDASACAKCFGGGGHFNASGCRVYGYYEDVHNKLLDVAKEMLSYA